MLNKITGEVVIDNVCIGPLYSQGQFVSSELYKEVIRTDKNGHIRYYLEPQRMGNDFFIVSLHFDSNEKLCEVLLSIAPNGRVPSWSNWSESDQLLKKESHNEWLSKVLGEPPYQFDWGSIRSVYDNLVGSSCMIIHYE